MSEYYDRQGNPITLEEWAGCCQTREQWEKARRVAATNIGDVFVSTVWLGLDHSFGYGPPLIFETMVFGGLLDQEEERYHTETQALAGHDQMVARVRDAL